MEQSLKSKTQLRIFFMLLLCFIFFTATSQNRHVIDSLQLRLKSDLNDSDRVLALGQLGWEVIYDDLQKGLDLSMQAKGLAERIGYKNGLCRALNCIGAIYTDLGDYPKALEAHLQQLELAKQMGSSSSLAVAYLNTSRVYSLLLLHAALMI